MKTNELLALKIEKEGEKPQIRQAQEELAELIVALSHLCRDRKGAADEVAEEMADVEIIMLQLRKIFKNDDAVGYFKRMKLHRLAGMLGVTYDSE